MTHWQWLWISGGANSDLQLHMIFRHRSKNCAPFPQMNLETGPQSPSAGEVDVPAVALDGLLGLNKVVIEIVERVTFDVAGERAQAVGIGQFQQLKLTAGVLPHHRAVDGSLQPFVTRGFDADGMEVEFGGLDFVEEVLGVGVDGLMLKGGGHMRIVGGNGEG